jgi:hypothetical protein
MFTFFGGDTYSGFYLLCLVKSRKERIYKNLVLYFDNNELLKMWGKP